MAKDNWENLAAAIVIQAADDYRDALMTIKHYRWGDPVEELEYASTVKTSCERFFCSDYAKLLTAADPVYIMERIKRESEEYFLDKEEYEVIRGKVKWR